MRQLMLRRLRWMKLLELLGWIERRRGRLGLAGGA